MGKSLNGKELGKGLSQRKDGLYQGRFVNRFGKKQTVYAKTLNEVRQKLRNEQYEDEKALNVVTKDVTLDEKILVDMLEKAIDSDLLIKNSAKQINTVISKEVKKERRVLTVGETELFLAMRRTYFTTIYM